MAEDCPERLDPAFLLYIARFRLGPGRRERLLESFRGRLIRLRRPADAEQLLASFDTRG
ncbi:MAG: hypothetical protein H0U34_10115 [Sphingomonas sp.]|jgi:hypothetical protein|nr:hypothetical protein [Sphingomonas sp.]